MRKFIIFLGLFLSFQPLISQRSVYFVSDNRLFLEGRDMYNDKNYAGCIDKLSEYKKTTKNPDLIQETEFLLSSSDYRQGKKNTFSRLHQYVETYPETRHLDEICFMIGSCYFQEANYPEATNWLTKSDLDNLSIQDQEDYAYRMAYSCFKTDKKDNAFRLFGLLKDNSSKYCNAATYYYAYLLYQDGKLNEALPLFNKLKDQSEFKPEVAYYITQINFAQGRYTQTIKEGKELLAAYPDHANTAEVNRLVGSSYYYNSDYKDAVAYLSKYDQACQSPMKSSSYILGLSHYNLKNYDEAIHHLGKSINLNDGMDQNSYLYLGQSYLKSGDNKNALMSFEAASRMNFDPQIKEAAMYNYAILLHQTSPSAFGESVTVLENFLNTYPNSRYSDKINDCLVEVYLTTKNYDTALNSIEKIKKPSPKILEARQKIYYHLGTVYFTNTDFNNAINYFSKSIGAGNYAPVEKEKSIYWRAESHFRKENYNEAIHDYRSFLESDQKKSGLSADAYYGLGYCYFQEKQYSAARTNFLNYAEQETDYTKTSLADAYARIGDCYFYDREFSDAEEAYSKSASLQPSMADYTIYQKGFVKGLQKNYKAKVDQLDKLIKLYPESRYVSDALYEKGRAYVMMDNSMDAIETYDMLINNFPESDNARKAGIQIGLLYFNANQPEKAITSYKKVIEKYPGSEEARVAVQDLKSVYAELNDVSGYAQYVNSLGGASKFEISEQDSLTYITAERFFMRGDVKQAQESMRKYVQTFPDGAFNVNAHYYLGNISYNEKDYDAAKTELQKVLDAGDNKFTENTLVLMSDIQYTMKDYDAALLSYQRLEKITLDKLNKETARLGIIRCKSQSKKYLDVVSTANLLLKEPKLDPETQTEATYYRAKAYLGMNDKNRVLPDLTNLAKDTRTVYGAEGKYLLAQYYFDNKEAAKAEAEVMDYIKKGTPHSYWLGRSFILLSDLYISQKDYLQARQYLESLKHNYQNTDDDIHSRISENMEKIKRLEGSN